MFADRPISLVPRLVNSGSSLANAPNSVVQTGVKSLQFGDLARVARLDISYGGINIPSGWEKKTTQLSPINS